MPKSKPFKMPVPEIHTQRALQALESQETRLRYEPEEVYLVMNYLLFRQVSQKFLTYYFSVNRVHLERLLDKDVMPFIRFLADNGILEGDHKWFNLKKRQHYRLSRKLKLKYRMIDLQPGSKQFELKQKFHRDKRKHHNNLEPWLKEMRDKLFDLRFDYEGAVKQWRESKYIMIKKIYHLCQIEAMADRRTRSFNRNNTNKRLDTCLTNLKSDYREFLVGDFVHIDAKNSQPYLFGQTLMYLTGCFTKGGDRNGKIFENSEVFPGFSEPKISKSNNLTNNSINNSTPTPISYTYTCGVFFKHDPSRTFGKREIQQIFKIPRFSVKIARKFRLNDDALKELHRFNDWVSQGTLYPRLRDFFFYNELHEELSDKKVKEIAFALFFSQNRTTTRKGKKKWIP